ncbi:hypothetical protein AB0L74_20355 [Streptomyces sp. NPDC052020]|uniref:hypothetical protein n=1 Tax=Streptomyces sp. NPDC052020 TaxID=3155677 RepID=UPI00341276E4
MPAPRGAGFVAVLRQLVRRDGPGSSPEAESGRGLVLVAGCAGRWGCEVRDTCTKTVWAEIACPP